MIIAIGDEDLDDENHAAGALLSSYRASFSAFFKQAFNMSANPEVSL